MDLTTSSPRVILVTGGCGYIGSQLVRDPAEDEQFAGATIRILDNMQREGYQALTNLPSRGTFQFVEGDILDPASVSRALRGVDAVVHLAAVVRTPFSFDHPSWTHQVNHWGTAQIIERCLDHGVKHFIYASSTAVYGPGGPFDETSPCRPVGVYAQSKWQGEQTLQVARQRGLAGTILRIGTIYGAAPVMRFEAVANRFAYLAGIGRPLTVYGSGEQARPLVHVRDASSAIRFCLERASETEGQVFNVVGETVTILDLVNAVREARPDIAVRYTDQDVLTHFSFEVNAHKIAALGWEPLYSVDAGLAEMVDQFQRVSTVPTTSMNEYEA